uniref:acetyl-CoA carboxylase biotin carboxyl carrier protein n=1 Tax=Pachymeniopsis lanceolata TaxID=151733 RepID=UPI002A814FDD|nr:acetyl-CoA carboxylase biotin carboxyl carrier protein [Pachymeniopsis lanceolata]WOL37280.1 acetyl-CoA carboxylase biotin carboxyl carrier protein [Pachymeniopsis lanceolata]
MKFRIKDLKKILYSIQNNNIDQIKVTSNEFELIINKTLGLTNTTNTITKTKKRHYLNINKTNDNRVIIQKKSDRNSNQSSESETYSTIVSPMVGTFYRSPAPNEPSFVELYDIVQKKQTVCIIEAMKLMNEIEAEVQGEIAEILVQDGEVVDCGQALMKVKHY